MIPQKPLTYEAGPNEVATNGIVEDAEGNLLITYIGRREPGREPSSSNQPEHHGGPGDGSIDDSGVVQPDHHGGGSNGTHHHPGDGSIDDSGVVQPNNGSQNLTPLIVIKDLGFETDDTFPRIRPIERDTVVSNEPIGPKVGNLNKIEHIVVLMQENRSFDQILGYLSREGINMDVNGLAQDGTPARSDQVNRYGGTDYFAERAQR